VVEPLVLMTSPFAPHLAEELWRKLGRSTTIAYEAFPEADPALLVAESVTLPVQVNGKVRGRIEIPTDLAEGEVRARALEAVAPHLDGKEPRKVIVVAGRMVSVVV
jgi:leucyl-tRNA synthetase